jgi:hypothetical protein
VNKTVIAFYVLLGSCALALSTFVSRQVGNIGVLAAYGVFFAVAVAANTDFRSRTFPDIRIPFQYHPALLYPVIVLWAVFIIGFALNPSFRALLRLGAFTVIPAITLFVVPAVISRKQAFRAIGILGAVSVTIALPSLVLGDYALFGFEIGQTLDNQRTELTLGFISQTPISFFDGISYFRVLATIGAVCAGALFVRDRGFWTGIACVLNLFGVFLGVGRATILGLVAAVILAIVYQIAGSKALAGATAVGVFAATVAFAVAAGVLPGPTAILQSVLGKRVGYWTAAYEAFVARPFLGWGLTDTTTVVSDYYSLNDGSLTGIHNSYLRLFVIGGVVGGVAYLVLSASALLLAFRTVREHAPLGLTAYCFVVVVLVIQLFTGGTIFGTNLSSILWALAIGYAQPGVAITDNNTTSAERSGDTRKFTSADSASTLTTDSE